MGMNAIVPEGAGGYRKDGRYVKLLLRAVVVAIPPFSLLLAFP
jgi:hypothetical protein